MLGANKVRWHDQMQVLNGEARVNVLLEGVVHWVSKGGQAQVEDMQTFLVEEKKVGWSKWPSRVGVHDWSRFT